MGKGASTLTISLLLLCTAVPSLGCLIPTETLNAEERACCKRMAGQCGTTPANSQGEWSFDFGLLGRNTALGSQLTARSMFTYGFTPFMQVSLTTPAILTNTNVPTTIMTGGDFFESNFAWRFQHKANTIGK